MKNLKKLISVIIAVIMIVGSFATVSAADYKDVESTNSYAKAIQVLSGLGIVKGDDQGNFNPTNDIKRSEMVALICRAMGEEDVANGAVTDAFDDVAANHWAAGNIAWGVNRGIVNGIGDKQFAPDASVSYQDAVVMIMRALGYDRIAQRKENGGYPGGYLKLASQYGVLTNAGYTQTKAATREIVAQLIFNGLTAGMVDVTEYGDTVEDDKYVIYHGKGTRALKNLLTDINDIYRVKAKVLATPQSDAANCIDNHGEHMVKVALSDACDNYTVATVASKIGATWNSGTGRYEATYYVGETDIADYLGYTFEAYVTEGEGANEYVIKAAVIDAKSVVTEDITKNFATITFDATNDVVEYLADIDDRKPTKIDIDADAATYYYNGVATTLANLKTALRASDAQGVLQKADKITFLGDKNGYDSIFITDYYYKRVKAVDAEEKIIKLESGSLDFGETARDEEFILGLFDAEGAEIDFADIKEDDVLNILCPLNVDVPYDEYNADFLNIYVTNETVTGKVGEKITVAPGVFSYKIDDVEYAVDGVSLKAGEEGVFYVSIDGKIIAKEASTVISKNFAFLMDVGAEKLYKNYSYTVRLFTADGKKIDVPVADAVKVYDEAAGTEYRYTAESTETSTTAATQTLANAFGGADTVVTTDDGIFTAATLDDTLANAQTKFAKRFFTYKTDADGYLTEIRIAGGTGSNIEKFGDITAKSVDWDADYNEFSGENVTDATKLFVAPLTGTGSAVNVKDDDLAIASFSALDDTENYKAYAYMLDGEKALSAVILAEKAGFASETAPLAVLQSIGTSLDEKENEVSSYTFVQSGKVVTLKANYKAGVSSYTYDHDDDAGVSTAAVDFAVGDVFQYVTNDANEIVEINVIYSAANRTLTAYAAGFDADDVADKELGFVFGVITNYEDGAITIANTVEADGTYGIKAKANTVSNTYNKRYKVNEVEGATYAWYEEALSRNAVRVSTINGIRETVRVNAVYAIVAKVNGKANDKIEDVITIALTNKEVVTPCDGGDGCTHGSCALAYRFDDITDINTFGNWNIDAND